jgi:alpha-galactosidase
MSKRTMMLMTLLAIMCWGTRVLAKPLKVYILAGQSNMEGQARIETFDYIGDDPATAPLLKAMRARDGNPRVCDHVWISYLTGSPDSGMLGEGFGKLTAGYGSRSNPNEDGGKIGPEFTFGLAMEQVYDGPILLIKTAWGGKSLNTDFRSPSAGPYKLNAFQRDLYAKQGKDLTQWEADKAQATGRYYRLMIDHVKKVLSDPKRVCPAYDEREGYDIAGFVWFQGWNDMCDGHTYPDSNKPGAYAEYTQLMAHFIRDVRKDLSTPKMPFVIGVIGVDGDKAKGGIANLRPAMAAPAAMPEFRGTVAAVETAPFWDHDMAALESKKGLADHRLSVAHVITEEGVMETPEAGVPGWVPIGKPGPEDRTWRFMSFDAQKEADQLTKEEKKRFRDVTLPAGLEDWYKADFDDSQWPGGKAPIGKGTWTHRLIGKGTVQYRTEWGEGEFILMRTTFDVDNLDYAALRLAVLARQGFHVYLNGHKINTYIWWKDEPQYRPIPLEPDHIKHLKTGKNVLAIYANAEYDRRTGACFATTDLMIEGITQAGLAYVNSQAYIDSQMHRVCTPEEARIIRGCSNGGYHYLGSAKTMAQIGQAFAEAMLEMENR